MADKIQKAGMHVVDTLPGIIPRMTDRDVMVAIVRRTLSLGRLSERLPISFFLLGFRGKICIFPPCRIPGSFYNARLRLEEHRLIFRSDEVYTPNAYGILRVARAIWPESKEIVKSLEDITITFERSKIPLQVLANEEELLMDLDELIKEGSKKFEEAKKKRRISVSWVLPYFKERVAEDGRGRAVQEPVTESEKKRVYRCIKLWLAECEKNDIDPKKQIDDICDYWIDFSDEGELVHHENGRPIELAWHTLSWQQYFTYRVEIDAWLRKPDKKKPETAHEEEWL